MEVEYPAQERNERGVKRSWLEINEDGKDMLLQDVIKHCHKQKTFSTKLHRDERPVVQLLIDKAYYFQKGHKQKPKDQGFTF